jgi:hypothetical protein
MRERRVVAALTLLCLSPALTVAQDASPVVSDAEFRDPVNLIDEAHAALMHRITSLTDQQWTFKPNPDRWSVGECVEHIARSERAAVEQAKHVIAGPSDPQWFTRTNGTLDVLRQLVPNRGPQGRGGRQAPTEIQPTEHWDRARAIREFYAAHGELRAYVETMDRTIKDRTQQSVVPALGWLNGYDWLSSIPLPVTRHTKQIIEVQSDSNYPKPAGTD